MILDEITSDSEYCEILFHTPCEVKIYSKEFRLYHNGKIICTVNTEGDIKGTKAKRSLYYLRSQEINRVVVKYGMDDNNECSASFIFQLH